MTYMCGLMHASSGPLANPNPPHSHQSKRKSVTQVSTTCTMMQLSSIFRNHAVILQSAWSCHTHYPIHPTVFWAVLWLCLRPAFVEGQTGF